MTAFARAAALHNRIVDLTAPLEPLALLALRLLAARVFLMSGLTKWDGLSIVGTTYDLFEYEYFADFNLPPWAFELLVPLASAAEIVLPLLLAVGLLGRYAAFGLLGMALVIQLFVYPAAWWNPHAWWIAGLALLVVRGPGAWSLDRLIFGRA